MCVCMCSCMNPFTFEYASVSETMSVFVCDVYTSEYFQLKCVEVHEDVCVCLPGRLEIKF